MAINPDRVRRAFDAISSGDLRTLQLMVRAGVPASYIAEDCSRSLLSHSASEGQLDIFHWLVENGADPTFRERSSWSAQEKSMIECACRCTCFEIISWLIAKSIPTKDELNRAIIYVSSMGTAANESVIALLKAGADPNYSDDDGETSLFVAVCNSAEDTAILLLQSGASPLVRTKSPHRGKYSRKTAFEVGRLNHLTLFCDECLRQFPDLGDKRKPSLKPKTISDCWEVIAGHLSQSGAVLASGQEVSDDDLQRCLGVKLAVATESIGQLRESWSLYDGSNDVGIFPVPDDITYAFLSMNESREALQMLSDIHSMDNATVPSPWNNRIPFAENGAGDYLVIEVTEKRGGGVLQFSHETRRFRKIASSLLDLLQRVAVEINDETLAFEVNSNSLR